MTDFTPFRDKLRNHEMPVSNDLWSRIEAQLPPEESRRAVPFFWLVLFASAMLGGSLMYLAAQPEAPTPTTSETHTEDTAIGDLPPQTGAPTSQSQRPTDILDYPTESNTTTSTPAEASMPAANAGRTSQPKSGSSNSTTASTTTRRIPAGTSSLLPSPERLTDGLVSRVDQAVSAQPNAEAGLTDLASAGSAFNPTPFLPVATLARQDMETATVPKLRAPAMTTDVHCYKFSKGTGNLVWSFDLFGGPGFSPRTLRDTGGESSTYSVARNATERHQYGWSAGTRVNLHLRNGLAFSAGLLYEQTGDVFDYTDTLATQSTTRIDSFFAADGTFLYADTNRVLVFGTLIKKIHNTYRHLDIPLLAGYEIPINRSMLMIHAGPVIHVTSSQEGQILDPALHPRPLDADAPNRVAAYKTNLGLSLYLGGGILFPLSEKFSALVEPRLLYRLSPVTRASYPLEERRHFAGLNLGLRYHLF